MFTFRNMLPRLLTRPSRLCHIESVLLFQYFHLGRRAFCDFINNDSFSYASNAVQQFLLADGECDGGDDDWLSGAALRKCFWLGYRFKQAATWTVKIGLIMFILFYYLTQESQS